MASEDLKNSWRTYAGLLGMLGAAIMLAGDLLLYAHWEELPLVSEAVNDVIPARKSILLATPTELLISGVLGPLSAFLYLFGAAHLYLAFRSSHRIAAILITVLFGVGFVASGAYHALWTNYGFVIQNLNESPFPTGLLRNAHSYMEAMNTTAAIPIGLGSLLLLVLIVLGKSPYPRWMSVFSPLPWLGVGPAVLAPIAADLAPPYGSLLVGAYYNVIMLLFFGMSVMTLRR